MPLPIQSLLPNEHINGLMLLTELSARTNQFGTDFIDVKLVDPTGSVSGEYSRGREVSGWAKGWGAQYALHPPCIVRVAAKVEKLLGRPHLLIAGLARYAPVEVEFRYSLPRSTWPWELLWAELRAHLRGEAVEQQRWALTQASAPAKHLSILAATNAHLYRQPAPKSPEHLADGFLIVPQATPNDEMLSSGLVGTPLRQSQYHSSNLVDGVFPEFTAQRRLVLLTEYLEWIRSLEVSDPNEAELRIPRLSSGVLLFRRGSDGRHELCPDACERLHPGVKRYDELPVVAICALDAQAYIRWRSVRDGVFYRLPTKHEYSRMYGGESFTGAQLPLERYGRLSHHSRPDQDGVGPFGHRDLPAYAKELCTITYNHHGSFHAICGGTWRFGELFHPSDDTRHDNLSFRLVFDP